MKTWYVEVERTDSFGREVVAETQEAAEDIVIKSACTERGVYDPRDWKITESHEVQRHGATGTDEPGAMIMDDGAVTDALC